jgi:hypothetical protein
LPRRMSRYSYFGLLLHALVSPDKPFYPIREPEITTSWLRMRLSSATQTAGEKRATVNTPHRIEAGRGAVMVVEILVWKVAGKPSEGAPLSV